MLEFGQTRIVSIAERQYISLNFKNDCLPPAPFETLLRDDEMSRCDLLKGAREGRSLWRLRGSGSLTPCSRDDLVVKFFADVRDEGRVGRMHFADRQLLCEFDKLLIVDLADDQVLRIRSLGQQSQMLANYETRGAWSLVLIEPKQDHGPRDSHGL